MSQTKTMQDFILPAIKGAEKHTFIGSCCMIDEYVKDNNYANGIHFGVLKTIGFSRILLKKYVHVSTKNIFYCFISQKLRCVICNEYLSVCSDSGS